MSRTPVTVRAAEPADAVQLRELWGDILRRGGLDEQLADVSTVIPGMRRKVHVETNLGVSDGRPLDAGVLARLRKHRWVRTYFVP